MRLVVLVLTFLFFFFNLSFSQVVTVIDEENQPLPMVVIKSKSLQQTVYTDDYGKADLSSFKEALDIRFHLFSYEIESFTYSDIQQADFVIVLKLKYFDTDEFTISATRWKQSKKEVPNRIATISPEKVELQNPQTAADLLETSGEVFVQKSQQGGGSPMIRGFATNRLLYTVDGVRMNTAIFRGGNIQNVISLDPFAIESTEIFFGPGGVIYGSDAIGGVMSFSTRTPQLSKNENKKTISGKAVGRFSTANNEKTGHASINVGSEKWASLTSFSYADYDDLKMGKRNGPDDYLKPFVVERIEGKDSVIENPNPLIQDPTGYSQFNIMQKFRYVPNESWDLNYDFHYSRTSEYARFDRLSETNDEGVPRNAVWNYGPQIWMMNHLNITNSGNHKLYDFLSIRLAHQYFQESRIDRRFNHERLRTRLEEVNALSLNVDFEKKGKTGTLFYGVEGVQNDVNSNATAVNINTDEEIAVSNRYPNADWRSISAYVNYQYKLTEKMLVQVGTRLSRFMIDADFTNHQPFFPYLSENEQINNQAITGNLGWIYNINRKTHLSVNASTGFRAPNVDDAGKVFDFQDESLTIPNTELDAEYAYNLEMNFSKIMGSILKLDGSLYYTYLDNALVRRAFEVNNSPTLELEGQEFNVFAIQNAAFAEVYGFNAGVEVRLAKNLKLTSHFNYQEGQEEMEDGSTTRSRHAAPWFGVTRLTYKHNSFDIQIYSMYSGEISAGELNYEESLKPFLYPRDENGELYSPSWYTLSVKMRYQISKLLTATLGVENITDQRYRTYSSGLAANGLNFIFSLNIKW